MADIRTGLVKAVGTREHKGRAKLEKAPTLADAIIREFLHPMYVRMGAQGLPMAVAKARKFVLDESMSAMLVDLGYAVLRDPGRTCGAIDALRQGARLPYEHVWIEWDNVAKLRRAQDEYGQGQLDVEHAPLRAGWLCSRHPRVETAFIATECISHGFTKQKYPGEREEMIARPQVNVFSYAWCTNDMVPPWAKWHYPRATHDAISQLVGVLDYHTSWAHIAQSPHYTAEWAKKFTEFNDYNMLHQLAGDLRFLWTLLATLDDLPVAHVDVRPSKGFVARGRYRQYAEHKVLRLTVPARQSRRIAQRIVGLAARRRAHMVRGHWRLYLHATAPGHEHTWVSDAEGAHLRCGCGSWKTWVADHQRGDATLGFVTHDYEVTKGATTA